MWIIIDILIRFVYSWFNQPKWLNRLALYLIIWLFVFKILDFIFTKANFIHTDVESARYMLSALIQGEAAIVAIVITLSLIVVQLSASSYSVRVIDIYKKTPDLKILIGIYGISIFYGLGVLKRIETVNPQLCHDKFICYANLENHISYSYYLGVFAFVSLIPYIMNTLDILKPLTMIKILSKKITIIKIKKAILERNCSENDPIQPITDIIVSSMAKYEYETVKQGLNSIAKRATQILKKEVLKKETESAGGAVSRFFFNHLETVGRIAVSRKDEFSAQETVIIIGIIGVDTAKQELKDPASDASILLGIIGNVAAKQNLDETVKLAAQVLAKIGKNTIEQELNEATHDVGESLRIIGITAATGQNIDAIIQVITSLEYVGILEVKHRHLIPILIVESLEKIGKTAAENHLEDATRQVLNSLILIEQKISEQEIEDTNGVIEESKKKIIEILDNLMKQN